MKTEYKNKQIKEKADMLYNKILEEWKPIIEVADKLSGLIQNINKGEEVILQQYKEGYLAQVIRPNNDYQRNLPFDEPKEIILSEHFFDSK